MSKHHITGDPADIFTNIPYDIPAEFYDESKDERFTCARCKEVFNMDISLVVSLEENKEVYYCGPCKRFALLRHQIRVK